MKTLLASEFWNTNCSGLLAFVVAFYAVAIANADVEIFTDRGTWEAAVAGSVGSEILVEDFNDTDPFNLPSDDITEVGPFLIETDNTGNGFARVASGTDERNIDGSTFFLLRTDGNPVRTATLNFPAPVIAWGMDFNQRFDQMHVTFETVNEIPIGPHNTSGFIGFIADTPFSIVLFSDPFISNSVCGMDNISFVPFQAAGIPGDINQDGELNLLDVAPMVELISTSTFQVEGDINNDGAVNLLDIGPFVELLVTS